jgi:hypothetical protein
VKSVGVQKEGPLFAGSIKYNGFTTCQPPSIAISQQTDVNAVDASQSVEFLEHALTILTHFTASPLRHRFCGKSLFVEAAVRPRGARRHTVSGHKPSTIPCLCLGTVRLNTSTRTAICFICLQMFVSRLQDCAADRHGTVS